MEKLENCPQCNGVLRGANYEMQYCQGDGCNYGWNRAPGADAEKEKESLLKQNETALSALRKIEDLSNLNEGDDGDHESILDRVNAIAKEVLWGKK